MSAKPTVMRRFQKHSAPLRRVMRLAPYHPAATEGRTLFLNRVTPAADAKALLISGHNNRKIGAWVEKGRWAGMPIFTLTLEERATCPRSCRHWLDCFGNSMQWPARHQAGPELEARLEVELGRLQARHPAGFVVRLHVLGDFYAVDYVERWAAWLDRFPALRVFGYTARPSASSIGRAIGRLNARADDRWRVRFSNQGAAEMGTTTIYRAPAAPRIAAGIVCPAQHGPKADSVCCGSCALCWGTRDNIVFLAH